MHSVGLFGVMWSQPILEKIGCSSQLGSFPQSLKLNGTESQQTPKEVAIELLNTRVEGFVQ